MPGRRGGRGGLGDRRINRRRGPRLDSALRYPPRVGGEPRRTPAPALSGAPGRDPPERSRRLRACCKRDAARDGTRRPTSHRSDPARSQDLCGRGGHETRDMTPLLEAATARGCRFQVGTDMLFEQIPAYLEFFGYGTTTPEELRTVAKVSY